MGGGVPCVVEDDDGDEAVDEAEGSEDHQAGDLGVDVAQGEGAFEGADEDDEEVDGEEHGLALGRRYQSMLASRPEERSWEGA